MYFRSLLNFLEIFNLEKKLKRGEQHWAITSAHGFGPAAQGALAGL
jgi:hypothetical protein